MTSDIDIGSMWYDGTYKIKVTQKIDNIIHFEIISSTNEFVRPGWRYENPANVFGTRWQLEASEYIL